MTQDLPFGEYAAYYDLLYADKDYEAETDYVLSLLTQGLGKQPATLLDVGCGTGGHARLLATKGIDVHGLDLSQNMIRLARERSAGSVIYSVADCTAFDLGKTFDCVTALFHVACYQNTNASLMAMFTRIAKHLRPGGVFLFDFWYGPAVLTDRPERRLKRMENERMLVERKATPVLRENDNVVEVHYDVVVRPKDGRAEMTTHEVHPMRYLFKPELLMMLDATGFDVQDDYRWMSRDQGLSLESWYGAMLATRRK